MDSQIQFEKEIKVSPDRIGKKIVLGIITFLIIIVLFMTVLSASDPGGGGGLALLILPFIFLSYVFFPVYFIVLAIRYSKEKGNMDILDKIAFYLLLLIIGGVFIGAMISVI